MIFTSTIFSSPVELHVSLCPLRPFRKGRIGSGPEAVSLPENNDIDAIFAREAEADDVTPRPCRQDTENHAVGGKFIETVSRVDFPWAFP